MMEEATRPNPSQGLAVAPADVYRQRKELLARVLMPGRLVLEQKIKTGETVVVSIMAPSDQDIHPEFGKRITEVLHDDLVLVARVNGVFVGSCLGDSWDPFINNLDVLKEHRNKGIGSAMLDAAAKLAREGGAKYLRLSTDHPEPARLYLRKGFVDTGGFCAMGEVYRLRL
jgi:GNAT superfamily N-acetyltransferase